jgi:hypothetical protein
LDGGCAACQRGHKRGIQRENIIAEILAESARPPLAEHIALAVEREATVLAVIVRAQGNNKFADCGPFLTG